MCIIPLLFCDLVSFLPWAFARKAVTPPQQHIVIMAAARRKSTSAIGRRVEVKCVDNVTKSGFLYTKDPLTNALVIANRVMLCDKEYLCKKEAQTYDNNLGPQINIGNDNQNVCDKTDCKHWFIRFDIIMGDAYSAIVEIHDRTDLDDWISIEKCIMQKLEKCNPVVNTQFDSTELKSRMEFVAEFLNKHHLPLVIDKDIIVLFDGLAKIEPPYISASCVSRNPVVLDKVRKLLQQCNFNETRNVDKN